MAEATILTCDFVNIRRTYASERTDFYLPDLKMPIGDIVSAIVGISQPLFLALFVDEG